MLHNCATACRVWFVKRCDLDQLKRLCCLLCAVQHNCLLHPYLLRHLYPRQCHSVVCGGKACGVCGEMKQQHLVMEGGMRVIYMHRLIDMLRCGVCVVKKQGVVVGGAIPK